MRLFMWSVLGGFIASFGDWFVTYARYISELKRHYAH